MRIESETSVNRPRAEVSDHIAHAEMGMRKRNAQALERLKRKLEAPPS